MQAQYITEVWVDDQFPFLLKPYFLDRAMPDAELPILAPIFRWLPYPHFFLIKSHPKDKKKTNTGGRVQSPMSGGAFDPDPV